MHRQEIALDRIEDTVDLFQQATGTRSAVTQLSPGKLGYRSTILSLPGLRFEWNTLQARIRSRDLQDDWGVIFGFTLPETPFMSFRGLWCDSSLGFLYREGQVMDYLAQPETRTLICCIRKDLVTERAWSLAPGPFRVIDARARERLIALCGQATTAAPAEPSASLTPSWKEPLLDAIEDMLLPWRNEHPPVLPRRNGGHYFELVDSAETLWREQLGTPPTARQLATQLGVPERTLYYSFKQALGIGPRHYLEVLRLHELRYCLLKADPESQPIARIAEQLGFEQLGRMAQYYRRHFHERPSDTLARSQARATPDAAGN